MTAKLYRIRGRVQGVSYRESLRRQAESLGLSGWVRNRTDGSVEAFVQGSPEQIAAIESWCRKGPPLARVDFLEEIPAEPDPGLTDFQRKDTL